jgi:hypothetical protein
MASLYPAQLAFEKMRDAIGNESLSDCVDFQISTHCTVVQPQSDECDFLAICQSLRSVFDHDPIPDAMTGVIRGEICGHLVLLVPSDERRYLRSVTNPNHGDCS